MRAPCTTTSSSVRSDQDEQNDTAGGLRVQFELPDLQYSRFTPRVKHPVNVSSLSTKEDQFSVSIQPAVGELLMPSTMTEQDFCKQQGELQGRQFKPPPPQHTGA